MYAKINKKKNRSKTGFLLSVSREGFHAAPQAGQRAQRDLVHNYILLRSPLLRVRRIKRFPQKVSRSAMGGAAGAA